MGTLLINITKGVDLNEAITMWEKVVAPTNYKRPQAIYSKKQLEDSRKLLVELGLINSLGRRFATAEDIKKSNVIYSDQNIRNSLKGSDPFENLSKGLAVNSKSFDKVEEVPVETFIKDIIPGCSKLEVMFESKNIGNLVSLITAKDISAESLFKWPDPASWAYRGNITDSMKDLVKAAGGKIDGVLRFSQQWNDEGNNSIDFDAHCIEPTKNEISFRNKYGHVSSGALDVDIIYPGHKVAVENITWSNKSKMPEGKYRFFVHNFSGQQSNGGFSAEIEFNGQIYSFNYNKNLKAREEVQVAEVTYSKVDGFSIKELIPSTASSKEIWSINTNQFHLVKLMMFSPNYWDELTGIGNKHYFFMLDKCINDETPNGFFNEFIKEDFMKHKRVFEALGSEMRVEASTDQLSGLGFSTTKHDYLIAKVEGRFNRTIKIIF